MVPFSFLKMLLMGRECIAQLGSVCLTRMQTCAPQPCCCLEAVQRFGTPCRHQACLPLERLSTQTLGLASFMICPGKLLPSAPLLHTSGLFFLICFHLCGSSALSVILCFKVWWGLQTSKTVSFHICKNILEWVLLEYSTLQVIQVERNVVYSLPPPRPKF